MYFEALAAGAGGDWWHVVILQAPLNATINVTDGDEDIDVVGTGDPQAIPVHNENSTYTITIDATGFQWTDQFNTTSVSGGYEFIDIDYGTIELTYDDEFRSQTITVTDNGSNTGTFTAPSTGNLMNIYVPATGTWSISATVDGKTYDCRAVISNLDIPKAAHLQMVPNGQTVLPTDDIQTWLACAEIKDKLYTTLSEVLDDEYTLKRVLTNDNANDYLKRSTTWIVNGSDTGITESELAMKAIGSDDYATETLMSDPVWNAGILASEYWEEVLPGLVPVMTDYAKPMGLAFENGHYASNNPFAWKAFDNDYNTYWQGPGNSFSTPDFIGYIFVEPIQVERVMIEPGQWSTSSAVKDIEIQGSNDTTNGIDGNWATLYTETLPNTPNTKMYRTLTNPVNYKALRILVKNAYEGSSGLIRELQFYGHETGSIASWLKAAGIAKPYLTLDEVLADNVTLSKLVKNHDAVDYLVTAKGLIDDITTSEKAMTYIGLSEYAMETLTSDEEWEKAMVFSEYAWNAFGVHVPIMTGTTTPEGQVIYSSYTSGYEPYKAFDDYGDFWLPTLNAASAYIGYKFTKPVCVKTMHLWHGLSGGTATAVTFTIQASNDNFTSDIHNLGTFQVSDELHKIIHLNNVDSYQYYRINTSNVLYSSGTIHRVYNLQFYGYDIDESKIQLTGAYNASLYHKVSGVDVPLTTLVGTKGEIDRSNIPTGKVTIYSTVADDPDNIGNDFSKEVIVDPDTCEIKVMPDDTLYWYGYEDSNMEIISTANGWTPYSNYTFIDPVKNYDYIDINSASAKESGIGSKNILVRGNSHRIAKGISGNNNAYGYNGAVYNKSMNQSWEQYYYIDQTVKAKFSCYNHRNSYPLSAIAYPGRHYCYALYETKHNPDANFFSAANDTVSFMIGNTEVLSVKTNDIGEAVVDYNALQPGQYELISSVAKDPNNLSDPFSKIVTVDGNKIYFMPDGEVLYWYGYISGNTEIMSTGNGWNMGTYTAQNPTFEEADIDAKTSDSTSKWSGVASKVPLSGKSHAITSGGTIVSGTYGALTVFTAKNYSSYPSSGTYSMNITSAIQLLSTDEYNDIYPGIYALNGREAKFNGFWVAQHRRHANLFSAACDRIYYLDGGVEIPVATTNEYGEAYVNWNLLPQGSITLYSSIAKDPDDPTLTAPFTKQIDNDGTLDKVYLMPDGDILYWYGYVGDMEICSTANGWSFGSTAFVNPTFDLNKITLTSASSNNSAIGTTKEFNITNKINALVRAVVSSTDAGFIRIPTSKAISGSTSYGIGTNTTLHKFTQNVTTNSYVVVQSDSGRSCEVHALWLD